MLGFSTSWEMGPKHRLSCLFSCDFTSLRLMIFVTGRRWTGTKCSAGNGHGRRRRTSISSVQQRRVVAKVPGIWFYSIHTGRWKVSEVTRTAGRTYQALSEPQVIPPPAQH